MLGPFATASRRYIAIHQVSLLSHASYNYSAGGVRCPGQRQRRQRQRQRVTEETAMAPWNEPKIGKHDLNHHRFHTVRKVKIRSKFMEFPDKTFCRQTF